MNFQGTTDNVVSFLCQSVTKLRISTPLTLCGGWAAYAIHCERCEFRGLHMPTSVSKEDNGDDPIILFAAQDQLKCVQYDFPLLPRIAGFEHHTSLDDQSD